MSVRHSCYNQSQVNHTTAHREETSPPPTSRKTTNSHHGDDYQSQLQYVWYVRLWRDDNSIAPVDGCYFVVAFASRGPIQNPARGGDRWNQRFGVWVARVFSCRIIEYFYLVASRRLVPHRRSILFSLSIFHTSFWLLYYCGLLSAKTHTHTQPTKYSNQYTVTHNRRL